MFEKMTLYQHISYKLYRYLFNCSDLYIIVFKTVVTFQVNKYRIFYKVLRKQLFKSVKDLF